MECNVQGLLHYAYKLLESKVKLHVTLRGPIQWYIVSCPHKLNFYVCLMT